MAIRLEDFEEFPMHYEWCVGDGSQLCDKFPMEKFQSWVGKEKLFEYQCEETEKSCDADLWHRTHQKVKVLRMLTPYESDYVMFKVEFEDGLIGDAMWWELATDEFGLTRPDYEVIG